MKPQLNTRAAAQWLLHNSVIIDTETTGLGEDARVMEIAIIDGETGAVLMNTFIHCHIDAEEDAFKLHGISRDETIDDGISTQALAVHLGALSTERCKAKTSFNWSFDSRLLTQTVLDGAPSDYAHPQYDDETGYPLCIMELANRHFHQHLEWDFEQSKFKRLSLARCCEIAGVKFTGQAHRALPDAVAARDLLVAIAEGRV
jgi:DNA polymerase III subunit epsilon